MAEGEVEEKLWLWLQDVLSDIVVERCTLIISVVKHTGSKLAATHQNVVKC